MRILCVCVPGRHACIGACRLPSFFPDSSLTASPLHAFVCMCVCIQAQCTPLHFAATLGHEAACELLLERGADVSAVNAKGSTPLHGAASRDNKHIVDLLLRHGASPNLTNQTGMSALHASATTGAVTVLQSLIAQGGDVLAVDSDGRTPEELAKVVAVARQTAIANRPLPPTPSGSQQAAATSKPNAAQEVSTKGSETVREANPTTAATAQSKALPDTPTGSTASDTMSPNKGRPSREQGGDPQTTTINVQ
eukprot:GHVU01053877.1.p1 GENE.GHVU01053877.1~~GHVU01053877.1.p1  ORF type:complete len:252 (-),score=40.50 GHVU01053877.1:524-1279(-)